MSVDKNLLDFVSCPECGGDIKEKENKFYECEGCGREYFEKNDILVLLPDYLKSCEEK